MLNQRENMIIIDGEVKTHQIANCSLSSRGTYNISFNNNPRKIYSYKPEKVTWMTNPTLFAPQHCHLFHQDSLLCSLTFIALFQRRFKKYWYVEFKSGAHKTYKGADIKIEKSCLDDAQSQKVFEYLRSVAAINPLKADDDETPLLLKQYAQIEFVHDDTVAAAYFNPKGYALRKFSAQSLIYPFGCNASQQKAVQAAFENQLSIIQGPPGTGKTQTILNIVANIIRQGKTVMVVSNNNSAILNVVEKMQRYDMGFIMALLGNGENKSAFIDNQKREKAIPHDISKWHSPDADNGLFLNGIDAQSTALKDVFAKQERLALARQEIEALRLEQTHFEQEMDYQRGISMRKHLTSMQLMTLWNELQSVVEGVRYEGLFSTLVNKIRDYFFRIKIHRAFTGVAKRLSSEDILSLITFIQHQFYVVKTVELQEEINLLENALDSCNASQMMKRLQDDSMCYLRNMLYHKYGNKHERPVFSICSADADFLSEYPVILSTTFSARTNLANDTILDYVIMDEASQISAETGALALMCARNAVIVGDSKQLPNVVTEEDKMRLKKIAFDSNIGEQYDCANNSFLQSVCSVCPEAPQTLLREHYRCHPKIINFCNQKFYGGQLVIMTADNGEGDVMSAKRTVQGNHSRDGLNLREIEVITREVLPEFSYSADNIGVIAPYNKQVDALNRALGNKIEVATVHKFQGREKEAIVMSVVDNTVSAFSDDPNLLNVAISRAKQKFCLVVSGNEQPKDCNIADLLAYIKYNDCTITDSKIHSIFDLLYNQYAEARMLYLKGHKRISEYDSENLTYAMLEQIIGDNPEFSHLGIVCHHPLRDLLSDVSLLKDEEKRYALHPNTHIDFLLYNRVSKQPVLAIETDGYIHHKHGTTQFERDERKNSILAFYNIPFLRLSTIGSDEQRRVVENLYRIYNM